MEDIWGRGFYNHGLTYPVRYHKHSSTQKELLTHNVTHYVTQFGPVGNQSVFSSPLMDATLIIYYIIYICNIICNI